jgi:type IV secretory pathway TrbF-like protein
LIFAGFSPFTLLALLIDPYTIAENIFSGRYGASPESARAMMFVSAILGTAAYATIVWVMYKSMVKNFDMTIRRQSR